MTVKEENLRLTPRQREGRAINAVAELLRRKLSVPNIYLEPPASLIAADLLAVDRGGAGDLHAVQIKLPETRPVAAGLAPKRSAVKDAWFAAEFERRQREIAKGAHRQLMSLPAHFRYLAIPAGSFEVLEKELFQLGLYPEDGIGRIGIITITEKGADSPSAEVALAPERFRVDPARLKNIETKLLSKSRPDIEVRI